MEKFNENLSQFTKIIKKLYPEQKHETDEKKSIVKGIRIDYEKKNIATFKKTITFKKKN